MIESQKEEAAQPPRMQMPQESKPAPAAAKQEVVRRKKGKRPGLYLRVPSQQSREFTKSQQYLEIFEGELPVYFFFWTPKSWSAHRSDCGLPSTNRFTVSWSASSGPRMWSRGTGAVVGAHFYG